MIRVSGRGCEAPGELSSGFQTLENILTVFHVRMYFSRSSTVEGIWDLRSRMYRRLGLHAYWLA